MEKSKAGFNIMNLLAQSVAKINALEDSNVKKSKLESKKSSPAATCPDTAAIVYHYLQRVNPSIASLLLDTHHPNVDMDCTITLEEVVHEWNITGVTTTVAGAGPGVSKCPNDAEKARFKKSEDIMKGKGLKQDNSEVLHNEDGMKDVGVTVTNNRNRGDDESCERNKGKSKIKATKKTFQSKKQFFTPREDLIILSKMEEIGDDLNMKELAVELGRNLNSVKNRVKKLNSGDSRQSHPRFSLSEDEAIMNKVLPGLQKYKLHELVLHHDESLQDFAAALGRPNKGNSFAKRWAHNLQPWIMQHFAGTLNLDIRMMLVNHVAETYRRRREDIDWDAIAAKSEFAGNTVTRLQYTFAQVLKKAKISNKSEASWEQLLNGCREYLNQARRVNSKKTELRRFQVIQYFENYVKKLKIYDFL